MNIYTPNIRACKYTKQILTNARAMEDFNALLIIMDRT